MKEIFAVTVSHSIYRIDLKTRAENDQPIVEKVAGRPESKIKVGERLRNGYFVGIGEWGIVLYHPGSRSDRAEDTNIVNWGGKTAQVVALFALKRQAEMCADKNDLKPFDPRWQEPTSEILRQIGDDHPIVKLQARLAMEIANT